MTASIGQNAGRQRGIAVITALLVVTIATVLAVELAWQTNLDLRRTESLMLRDQAHQYAYGAEAYAAALLEDKLQDQTGDSPVYSRADDEQACQGFQFSIDQGGMTGGICDLQSRFNLNNLVQTGDGKHDELVVEQFRRLLAAISVVNEDIDIDAGTIDVIVDSVTDWIDPDSSADYNGAEDDAYTGEQPPYRAANFWFTSVSELRAVRGVTPEIFSAIVSYVAALPVTSGQHTKINVNTAPVAVLMSLGKNITMENAAQWVSDSADEPFKDDTPFTGFVEQDMLPYLEYSSSYFELKGAVSIGTARLGMYSLLEYDGQAVSPRLRQFDVVEVVESADAAEPVNDEQLADE